MAQFHLAPSRDLGHFITTGLNNPEFLAISTVPQPGGTVKIQSLAISGKKLNLTVETSNCGATLTVQQTSRLVGPEWSDVSDVIFSPCQVGVSTATFAVPSASPEFYRVVLK